MANYFTGFSTVLPLANDKEIEWCKKRLEELFESDSMVDCDFYAIEDHEVWFRTDDGGGTLEHVADFVQKFMRKFKKQFVWSMQWSHWCDSNQLDAFGGGVVVVSAKEQRWMTTNEWASQNMGSLLRELKKGLKKK